MSQVLLVEDEINVRRPLAEYLRKEGFEVAEAPTLEEARARIAGRPEIVILDWMLPDGQGIELLRAWRSRGVQTPAILLTARADLVDKVVGLELGADDYVTKPFEPRELVARIRAQLRSKARPAGREETPKAQATLESPGLLLNLASREGFFHGKPLELTKTEFDLLRIFLENPNQVFSREELLKQVWGYDQYPTTRTVDTHVLQLRQKTAAELFETVHKIGYRFRPAKARELTR